MMYIRFLFVATLFPYRFFSEKRCVERTNVLRFIYTNKENFGKILFYFNSVYVKSYIKK